jgi:hypothetical protein
LEERVFDYGETTGDICEGGESAEIERVGDYGLLIEDGAEEVVEGFFFAEFVAGEG